jgi:apolipoprotein N-acyltransferase
MHGVDAAVAVAAPARVAIVQANTPHTGTTLRAAIDAHRAASAHVEAEGGADVIVWPETALAGVVPAASLGSTLRDEVLRGVDADALPLATPVLSGAMLRRPGGLTNSAVLFDPDGAVHGVYDKVHPLVLGEYIPFGDRFPVLHRWVRNAGHLAAGAPGQAPLLLGAHRIAPLICYEDLLAEYTNDVVREGQPDLLVNLTNDAWFGDSGVAAAHFALAKLRAVEHRRYLVVASNSGVSGFVDPAGRSFGETPLLESATRTGVVRWLRASTPYERLGNLFSALAAFVALAMAFGPRASSLKSEARIGLRAVPHVGRSR